MAEAESVRELAKEALISALSGELGVFLWERAQRLVRSVEYISQLPKLAEAGLKVDRFCLTAAAYFSEAGLACYPESKVRAAKSGFGDVNGEDLPGFSAGVAEQKLAGVIETFRIGKITRIIIESGSRSTGMAEAMILADARNLEDMGLVGVLNEYRRCICRGRGVSEVLQKWKKKTEYRYWQARLEDGFRFEQVRKIAEQRLCAAGEFMDRLEAEAQGQDIEWPAVRFAEGRISS